MLGQILAEVKAVGAEVSAVKVTVATAVAEIEHRARQGDDHETRIRATEVALAAAVTEADLEALEQRQAEVRKSDAEAADRAANKRLVWIGLVMTAVIAVVNVAIAVTT